MKKRIFKILLVLIIVLCLFFSIKIVVHIINNNKKKTYDSMISTYLQELKHWHNDNINNYKNSIIVRKTLKELVEENYSTIKINPYTKENVDSNLGFCIIKDNDEYEYLLADGTNCGEILYDRLSPTELYNGYVNEEKISISFPSYEGLEYYVKSSVDAEANINLNFRCGRGKIATCKEIRSTKKIKANVWYRVSGNIEVLYEKHNDNNALLNAYATDNLNYKESVEISVDKIDRKNPIVVLDSPISSTNSISVKIESMLDNETEIVSSVCKYGTKENEYTTTSMSSSRGKLSKCNINFILKDKIYYYEVCATDAVGNVGCATGSSLIQSIKNPKVTYLDEGINILYNSSRIKNLSYYIKSDVELTLNTKSIAYCGKDIYPSECIASKTNTLLPNIWYKVEREIEVSYEGDGIIYMIVSDGDVNVTSTATIRNN